MFCKSAHSQDMVAKFRQQKSLTCVRPQIKLTLYFDLLPPRPFGIESPTILIGGVGAGGGTGLDARMFILSTLQFTFIASLFNNYWWSINFRRYWFIRSNLFHVTQMIKISTIINSTVNTNINPQNFISPNDLFKYSTFMAFLSSYV